MSDNENNGIKESDWLGDERGELRKNRGDVGREQFRGEPYRGGSGGQEESSDEAMTSGGNQATVEPSDDKR
jgi:hypothetical protein